jgi:hypothetical protein
MYSVALPCPKFLRAKMTLFSPSAPHACLYTMFLSSKKMQFSSSFTERRQTTPRRRGMLSSRMIWAYEKILERLFAGVQWTAVSNIPVYSWAAVPLVTVRVTGDPRLFSTTKLKRRFERFGPVSKINRRPDRTWSSAANGVVQLLVQLRPGVVLPHFVNVLDPQGILCECFAVYTEGRCCHCFSCGGPGHIGPFCKASCLAPEADPSLWSSMVYNGPVLATATVGSPSSAAAVPAASSAAAEAAACSTAAVATVPYNTPP